MKSRIKQQRFPHKKLIIICHRYSLFRSRMYTTENFVLVKYVTGYTSSYFEYVLRKLQIILICTILLALLTRIRYITLPTKVLCFMDVILLHSGHSCGNLQGGENKHAYTHTYIHKHTHIHTYVQTYIHTHIYTYIIHTCVHTYIHTYIHTHINTHTHTHIYTYTHT